MPGVPGALAKLKDANVKLAVLSDTESGEQGVRKILKQLNIEQYFDAVVSSIDIGHAKPAAEAFFAATSALELDVSACAFIGHDEDELVGARQAELFAIGYNCAPELLRRNPPLADVFINDFDELLSVAGVDTP